MGPQMANRLPFLSPRMGAPGAGLGFPPHRMGAPPRMPQGTPPGFFLRNSGRAGQGHGGGGFRPQRNPMGAMGNTTGPPIFVGPRGPESLPLYTVDHFLPCASRHFANNERQRQRQNRQRLQEGQQQQANGGNSNSTAAADPLVQFRREGEAEVVAQFRHDMRNILQTVIDSMNDGMMQAETAPAYQYLSDGRISVGKFSSYFHL